MRGLFDESGTHNDAVTTIAGWVFADRETPRECLRQWQAALVAMIFRNRSAFYVILFFKDHVEIISGNHVGGLLFLTKEKMPLMQAADFLVYEMNKGVDIALHKHGPIRDGLKAIGSLRSWLL